MNVNGWQKFWIGIAALAMALLVRGSQAELDWPPARLRLTTGQILSGRVLQATGDSLHWQDDNFRDPWEFDWSFVSAVEFPLTSTAAEPENGAGATFRLLTRTGESLVGTPAGWDATHFWMDNSRQGRVGLLRDQLLLLRRTDGVLRMHHGPLEKSDWRVLSAKHSLDDWRPTPEGGLTTVEAGAELYQDLELPDFVELEISLRWSQRPAFVVAVGAATNHRLSSNVVKLETWDSDLVLQSLARNGEFTKLLTFTDARQLQLRLRKHQQTGRISVFSEAGQLLGELDGEPGQFQSGIYVKNKGTDLTVSALAVNRTPDLTEIGQGAVQLERMDGTQLKGQLDDVSPTGTLQLREAAGTLHELAWNDIASITFSAARHEADGLPEVQLNGPDGTSLRGRLVASDGQTITLQSACCTAPITTRLEGACELRFRRATECNVSPDEFPFELAGSRLQGRPGPAGPDGSVGWQPLGSLNASRWVGDSVQDILRVAEAPATDSAPCRDIVSLRNGDMFPCKIDRVDGEQVFIHSEFTAVRAVPLDQVKAMELQRDSPRPAPAFDDPLWRVERGHVERTPGQATIHGMSTFSHAELLQGDVLECDLQWHTQGYVMLGLGLQHGHQDGTSPMLMLYYHERQLHVGLQRPAHNRVMHPRPLAEPKLHLSVTLAADRIQVQIDHELIIDQPLPRREQAGRGVSFMIQQLHVNQGLGINAVRAGQPQHPKVLTIANLKVRQSGTLAALGTGDLQREALLTVPRGQKDRPPSHILVATNGDLLRGRLIRLSDEQLEFRCRLRDHVIPRSRVTGIICLDEAPAATSDAAAAVPEPDPAAALGSETVAQVTLEGGIRFSLADARMQGEAIVGRHAVLGDVQVPRDRLTALRVGPAQDLPRDMPFASWQRQLAPEPRFASEAGGQIGVEGDTPLVGTKVDSLQIPLLDGSTFDLAEHSDKIIVLEFWATWCGPCVHEMPRTRDTLAAFPPGEVLLLAVNQHEGRQVIREFLTARDWTFQVALDPSGEIGNRFQVNAIPQTVIIGRDGTVERVFIGAPRDLQERLAEAVESLRARSS